MTDGVPHTPQCAQPARQVGEQRKVDSRASGQHAGVGKRGLEGGGAVSKPKRMRDDPKLSSRVKSRTTQDRRQEPSSQRQLSAVAAQAAKTPLKRGRGRPRGRSREGGRGGGRSATHMSQAIRHDEHAISSPLAEQSGRERPRLPQDVLVSPDGPLAQTDAEVARSWQRRMSGYFDPSTDG